jgi:hypothetical protein
VQEGFAKWKAFHDRYSAEHKKIQALDPGLAAWEDLDEFLAEHAGASPVAGFSVQRFQRGDGDVRPILREARVIAFSDGVPYACGDYAGSPVYGPNGIVAQQLGLNVAPVAQALRRVAFPEVQTGAAHLRWPRDVDPIAGVGFPYGVLVLLRQSLRMEQATWTEGPLTLHCYVLAAEGQPRAVEGEERAILLRAIFRGTVRVKAEDRPELTIRLEEEERAVADSLRRISREQLEQGLRYAVVPLFAAVMGAPADK